MTDQHGLLRPSQERDGATTEATDVREAQQLLPHADHSNQNRTPPSDLWHPKLLIICAASFMVGADMALLPSSFKALEQSFGFSTSQLGGDPPAHRVKETTHILFW